VKKTPWRRAGTVELKFPFHRNGKQRRTVWWCPVIPRSPCVSGRAPIVDGRIAGEVGAEIFHKVRVIAAMCGDFGSDARLQMRDAISFTRFRSGRLAGRLRRHRHRPRRSFLPDQPVIGARIRLCGARRRRPLTPGSFTGVRQYATISADDVIRRAGFRIDVFRLRFLSSMDILLPHRFYGRRVSDSASV
jgi:hypothetical protein